MSSFSSVLSDRGAEIVPHLFIGDKRLAADFDALQQLGVSHIVNVTPDIRHYYADTKHGQFPIQYLRCACHDTDQADLSEYFPFACDFIETAISSGHSVLVHCQQGISRSST